MHASPTMWSRAGRVRQPIWSARSLLTSERADRPCLQIERPGHLRFGPPERTPPDARRTTDLRVELSSVPTRMVRRLDVHSYRRRTTKTARPSPTVRARRPPSCGHAQLRWAPGADDRGSRAGWKYCVVALALVRRFPTTSLCSRSKFQRHLCVAPGRELGHRQRYWRGPPPSVDRRWPRQYR